MQDDHLHRLVEQFQMRLGAKPGMAMRKPRLGQMHHPGKAVGGPAVAGPSHTTQQPGGLKLKAAKQYTPRQRNTYFSKPTGNAE